MFSAICSGVRRLLSSPAFNKYLLITNMISSGIIDSTGDVVTQKVVEQAEKANLARAMRMGLMGVILGGPYHYWYIYLDKWFPLRKSSHIAKKVVLDICVTGPFSIAAFYLGMSTMEGKTWEDSCSELKEKFWFTFMLDLAVWPAFQTFNFYFLPISLRLMSANVAYFGWAMLLSYLKHNDFIKAK